MERLAGLAIEHLLLRMRSLNGILHAAVERQRAANRTLVSAKAASGVYLSETQVAALLARADAFAARSPHTEDEESPAEQNLAEQNLAEQNLAEQELRQQALAAGGVLPLDRLAAIGLTRQEQDALVICAAPELDRSYERLYGFVLDDLTRLTPSVALLVELTCTTPTQRAWGLHVLGPFGPLRRRRLLVATGEASAEARQELRLGPGVLDFLVSGRASPAAIFRDRAEIAIDDDDARVPAGVDPARIRKIGDALRHGSVTLVSVNGGDGGTLSDVVRAIAAAADLPIRRLVSGDIKCRENCPREEVRKAFLAAATLRTMLWVERDLLTGEAGGPGDAALETVAEQLVVSPVPVILSGRTPWRPTEVLAARAACEFDLEPASYAVRTAMWQEASPALNRDRCRDLAARFRLTPSELQAVSRVAHTHAALAGNGRPAPVEGHLDRACAIVTQRATVSFARLVTPRRTGADLVLPSGLHDQVLEIGRFARAWPRVADDWGFTRLESSTGAIKALFTGDSGTGKTLAAEVIAGELSAPLIKVDLARTVSKWIGETEKNLAAIFDEARSMHAVLFFDEADALFGRRGEVQRGIDRYANLEVSYLLQRLEEHDAGVVILASNLKDNIDAAFTRRFQVTLHFPRPTPDLRRRLWRLAIPERVTFNDVDFDVLARIDLTGGGITGAARTAALLAADAGSEAIGMEHLVRGLARQFKREARLLTPAELGRFAPLLREM